MAVSGPDAMRDATLDYNEPWNGQAAFWRAFETLQGVSWNSYADAYYSTLRGLATGTTEGIDPREDEERLETLWATL